MSRFFYGVYLDEEPLAAYLDAMRLLCDPNVFDHAHVTLRGPYPTTNLEPNAEWRSYVAEYIRFVRPTDFFSERTNAIIIQCDLPLLETVWWKPSYPEGIPHITIFEGHDWRWGSRIREVLGCFDWDFTVKGGTIVELSDALLVADQTFIRKIRSLEATLRIDFTWSNLVKMNEPERLQHLYTLSGIIHDLKRSSPVSPMMD